MKFSEKIDSQIKDAMKSKDSVRLESLRAIKSAILLFNTQKRNSSELSESDETHILTKLVKQRKESAEIYKTQNRDDLAQVEINQAKIIKQFLPKQLSESEIEKIVIEIIHQTKSSSIKEGLLQFPKPFRQNLLFSLHFNYLILRNFSYQFN